MRVSAGSKPIIARRVLQENEDGNDDDQLPQGSQGRERDHFLVGCFLWREGPFAFVFFSTLFVTMIASQLFWIPRVIGLGERFILGKPQRIWLKVIVGVPYLFFFASNFGPWYIPRGDSTHLTLRSVLLDVAWSVWLVGSWVGFALVMVFWTVDRAGRAAAWVYRKAREAAAGPAAASMPGGIPLDPASPARRRLLEQAAVAVSAVPFVAAAYGLLYGRLDV